ncbi:MAG: bifunctional metallophosphatase/5'-nucleotidase [Planctomycetota bacterium]|jgi:2',3'-cyclic-nucleotide 2'-phosphodiesterase (5'-nucleotidase family)
MARVAFVPFLVLLLAIPGIGEEEPVRITVVATCDMHGALSRGTFPWSGGEEVGGMDTLSGYLRIVREENPGGVVALDAGDLMQGTLVSGRFKGRPMTRALRIMRFDAVALGNHEFDWGLRVLRRRRRDVRFLGANVAFTNGRKLRFAKPWRMVTRNGVRIGIIGVAHPDTPTLTAPAHVADLEFSEPAAAVARALDEVEAEGADLVVVLAHLGTKGPDHGNLGALARALDPSRVHLLLGGHTHGRTTAVENGIPLLQAWPTGTGFGRIDFDVDTAAGTVAASFPEVRTTWASGLDGPATYRDRPVWPVRRVARLVRRFERRVAKARSRVVGELVAPLARDYRRESSMGDWVADVLRAGPPEADLALVNSGGLRADLDAGPVTFGDVYEVMPFDNRVVRVRMTGAQVRETLETGVSGHHGVIQVSGLAFEFDYDRPEGERILSEVLDARTGSPLDPEGAYIVAVPDFLADGGDDFVLLPDLPQERDDVLVRDLLVRWLRKHRPLTPPDPSVERRMVSHGSP